MTTSNQRVAVVPLIRLPIKDKQQFSNATKQYDERNYSGAAKEIEALLAKWPSCVELLALKCLIYRNIPDGGKEIAINAVKLALKMDIRSAVAWHAMGSYYRLEGHHEDALKSYKQAVNASPNSLALLSDLSYSQLFLGRFFEFLETRRQILTISPKEMRNWLCIPFGLHLCKDYRAAASNLLNWWSLGPEITADSTNSVDSELRIYLVYLLEKDGQYERALSHVKAALSLPEGTFKNIQDMLTLSGRIQLRLRRYDEAKDTYKKLIKLIPSNNDYLFGYFLCHVEFHHLCGPPFENLLQNGQAKTSEFESSSIIRLYPDILTDCGVRNSDWISFPSQCIPNFPHLDKYGRQISTITGTLKTAWYRGNFWEYNYSREDINPSSSEEADLKMWTDALVAEFGPVDAIVGFPLAFYRSEEYVKASLDDLFRGRLLKSSPAVLSMAMSCFNTASQRRRELVLEVIDEISSTSEREPIVECLCDAIRAQHLAYFESNIPAALEILNHAMATVPTLVELAEPYCRMLTLSGRLEEAEKVWHKYSLMDKSDRYLNQRAGIAKIRCGLLVESRDFMRKFDEASELKENGVILDIQNMTIDYERASYFFDSGAWDSSLAAFKQMHKRYTEIKNESHSFYFYCLRRGAMRHLAEYIHVINRLGRHWYMWKSVVKIIDICLLAYDGWAEVVGVEKPLELARQFLESCPLANFQIIQRAYEIAFREDNMAKMTDALVALVNLSSLDHVKALPYAYHFAQNLVASVGSSFEQARFFEVVNVESPRDLLNGAEKALLSFRGSVDSLTVGCKLARLMRNNEYFVNAAQNIEEVPLKISLKMKARLERNLGPCIHSRSVLSSLM